MGEGSPRQGQLDGHSTAPFSFPAHPWISLLCGLKNLGTPDWRKAGDQEEGSELARTGLRGLPGKHRGSLSPSSPLLTSTWGPLKGMERVEARPLRGCQGHSLKSQKEMPWEKNLKKKRHI